MPAAEVNRTASVSRYLNTSRVPVAPSPGSRRATVTLRPVARLPTDAWANTSGRLPPLPQAGNPPQPGGGFGPSAASRSIPLRSGGGRTVNEYDRCLALNGAQARPSRRCVGPAPTPLPAPRTQWCASLTTLRRAGRYRHPRLLAHNGALLSLVIRPCGAYLRLALSPLRWVGTRLRPVILHSRVRGTQAP